MLRDTGNIKLTILTYQCNTQTQNPDLFCKYPGSSGPVFVSHAVANATAIGYNSSFADRSTLWIRSSSVGSNPGSSSLATSRNHRLTNWGYLLVINHVLKNPELLKKYSNRPKGSASELRSTLIQVFSWNSR